MASRIFSAILLSVFGKLNRIKDRGLKEAKEGDSVDTRRASRSVGTAVRGFDSADQFQLLKTNL